MSGVSSRIHLDADGDALIIEHMQDVRADPRTQQGAAR